MEIFAESAPSSLLISVDFFRWALGSWGGARAPNAPPLGYAPERRPARVALAAHSRSFEMPRSRTVQFSRFFVLSCVRLWNGLHESVFSGEGVGAFKTSVNHFF